MKIRPYEEKDFQAVLDTINDGATAYRGHIPEDCYHTPYMKEEYLSSEIKDGVNFWCCESDDEITGVMGIQDRGELYLIRHAYVRTSARRKGIGSLLMTKLLKESELPFLIGCWKGAAWAIDFYRKQGFETVTEEEKNLLLRTYWHLPDRQIETSHVMGDEAFLKSPLLEKLKAGSL